MLHLQNKGFTRFWPQSFVDFWDGARISKSSKAVWIDSGPLGEIAALGGTHNREDYK